MSDGPLAGLKVLDFCWVVAGPMVGRALADFGATVVKVESSERLDASRVMGPFPDGVRDVQKSLLFETANAGKFGLTLDMGRTEGVGVARDLARWADVVLESFSPGQMVRWGLDYDRLSAGHPDLIMLSTSLMGQTGPLSACAGYGNIGGALSGFQGIVGRSGERPIGPFGPYTDYVGPKFGIVLLLAALDRVRKSGVGFHIDLAQVEASLMFLAPQIAECSMTGRNVESDGNRDPAFAPHGVYRCRGKDRWVAIVARDDVEWGRLADIVGGADLMADRRFLTLALRKANEDSLDAIMSEWTAGFEPIAVEEQLQRIGVPAHVVASSADFCADPQIDARRHLLRISHGLMDDVLIEGSRFRLSDTPASIDRSAPTFGRDNRHVLRLFAGYDDDRIADLEAAGVLK